MMQAILWLSRLDISADYIDCADFLDTGLTNVWRPIIAKKFGFGCFKVYNMS